MNICSAVDDAYLWAWLNMAHSAQLNAGKTSVTFVLGNVNSSISLQNVLAIKTICKALKIDVQIMNFDLEIGMKTTHQPTLVYAKLLFLDTLEDDFIWIDADCLLLPGWTSIQTYFGEIISRADKVLAACLDQPVQEEMYKFPDNLAFRKAQNNYFNSGVFLAVPSRWRELGFSTSWKAVGFAHKELGFRYHDQDILNYLISDRSIPVSGEYNVWESVEINRDTRIIHYTGKPKPWNLLGNARIYYLAKDVLLDYSNSTDNPQALNKVLRQIMYWRAEDNLEKMLHSLGFFGTKKKLTSNFSNAIKPTKRDLFKLFLLRFFAKPWSLNK